MKEFIKYPKIKQLGDKENKDLLLDAEDEIVIQEKIDGGNARFMYHNGEFVFGSRTQELGGGLENGKPWIRCLKYIRDTIGNSILDDLLNNYIFFGENCIRHSTPYDFENMPPFIGFDVYDISIHKFLDWREAKKMYESLGFIFVPIIKVIKAGEMITWKDEEVPKSKYYDGQAEGVVFKNNNKQIFAKYVTAKHKETATKVFGGSKKWATTDTNKMVATYCTNPRIEKKIFELIHEGNELEMPLMKFLPTRVFEDIREEHYRDILNKNYKIDVGNFRRGIATRCLNVLKQMMVNSALVKDIKEI